MTLSINCCCQQHRVKGGGTCTLCPRHGSRPNHEDALRRIAAGTGYSRNHSLRVNGTLQESTCLPDCPTCIAVEAMKT
jgi:hypothetical protein